VPSAGCLVTGWLAGWLVTSRHSRHADTAMHAGSRHQSNNEAKLTLSTRKTDPHKLVGHDPQKLVGSRGLGVSNHRHMRTRGA
jgi:hypothetical protein